MKKKLLCVLGFIITIEGSPAQDTLALKLSDAMDATIRGNNEILLATLDQESAVAKFNETNAVFLPQVNLSYTAMATNNPLNVFGFKLQQQSVSLTDFNPQLLNHPSAAQNYMAKAEWNQPLINLDMIYQRRAAEQQIDVYYYKMQRTKEYMMFEVQKAYVQLQLSHQAGVVLAEALHTVTSIFETSNNYFEKGYMQKSDLLMVQVQLASIQSKLEEAKSNVHNASDYISLLMGVKRRPVYSVDPLIKISHAESLENQAPAERADFKALESALKAQEIMINSVKMSYLPKLNAFANYMLNDKTAFGFGSNSYFAGVQFSWSLFNGTASYHRTAEQRIAHSRIERQLSYQKEQSQLELDKTFRQLQDTQFAIQQHETSVNQAAEELRILQNRFQQGLVTTSDLLRSQSALSEQKLQLTEAISKHNITLAYLQFLTSASEHK